MGGVVSTSPQVTTTEGPTLDIDDSALLTLADAVTPAGPQLEDVEEDFNNLPPEERQEALQNIEQSTIDLLGSFPVGGSTSEALARQFDSQPGGGFADMFAAAGNQVVDAGTDAAGDFLAGPVKLVAALAVLWILLNADVIAEAGGG